jgi:hypothetical protein
MRRGIVGLGALVLGINMVVVDADELPPVPPDPALGEIINVTGFADTDLPDVENCVPSANPAFDLDCPTLREAVLYANENRFDPADPAIPAPQDTINLAAGTYTLTTAGADETFAPCVNGAETGPPVTNTPDAGIGDLDITDSLIIQGRGRDTTIVEWPVDATAPEADRVFHVYNPLLNVFATFSNLTVQNGLMEQEVLCEGPPSEFGAEPTVWYGRRAGGGIAVGPAANTALVDPNITGADHSAGMGGSQRPGDPGGEIGGTYLLTLDNVAIVDNMTDGDGGGLYNAGPMSVDRAVISRNISVYTNGGAIYNEGVSTINNSTISDNIAEGGGGLFLTGRPEQGGNVVDVPVTILNSTLSGNIAIGGGAISSRVVTVTLTNTTISGNTGEDVGGGVYANGVVDIRFSTITGNQALGAEQFGGGGVNAFPSGLVSISLLDTLLSSNTAGSGLEEPVRDANCGCTGDQPDCVNDAGDARMIQTLGYNLSDDTSCNLDAVGDQPEGIDPRIGPLADNGGPTMTHALLAGSPAINNGVGIAGITTDQRGYKRDRKPDIGAYEVSSSGGGGGGGGGCSMRTAQSASVDPLLAVLLLASMAWIGTARRQKIRQ